jgi:hypothetical protein
VSHQPAAPSIIIPSDSSFTAGVFLFCSKFFEPFRYTNQALLPGTRNPDTNPFILYRAMKYNLFFQQKGGTPDKVEAWSRFNEPIPNDGKPHGNSRRHGDASPAVQAHVIDTIIGECQRRGLSREDTAHVLAIARVESGFNPDAAAGTSSASGIGQFITKTGSSYGLNDNNRFDIKANTRALVDHYIDNKALAMANGKDAAWVYKYHHDGPSKHSGGLGLAHKEVLPYARAYSGSELLAHMTSRAKEFYGEAKQHARAFVRNVGDEARGAVNSVRGVVHDVNARAQAAAQSARDQVKPLYESFGKKEVVPTYFRAAMTSLQTAAATTVAVTAAANEKSMNAELSVPQRPEASKEASFAKEVLAAAELPAPVAVQPVATQQEPIVVASADPAKMQAIVDQAVSQGLSAEAAKALAEHRLAAAPQAVQEQPVTLNSQREQTSAPDHTQIAAAPASQPTATQETSVASATPTTQVAEAPTAAVNSATITLAQALADHMSEKGFDAQSVALAPELAGRVAEEASQKGAEASALVLHKDGEALASLVAKPDAQVFAKAGDSVLALDPLDTIARNGLDTDAVAALRGLAPEKTQPHSDLEVYQAAPAELYAKALDPEAPLNSPSAVKELVAGLDTFSDRGGFAAGAQQATQVAEAKDAKEAQHAAEMAMSA